jgi:TolA-binding protein
MRTRMRLALAVLLTAALTSASLRAAESDAEKIARLQRELDAEKIANLQREIDSLRQRIELLERTIRNQDEMLRGQITRQSGYFGPPAAPPNGNGAAAAAPTTASVTLRNQYLADASVTINGRSYRVAAGQTAEVRRVPLGTFNYEVNVDGFGVVQPLTSATLSARGHLITIYPR